MMRADWCMNCVMRFNCPYCDETIEGDDFCVRQMVNCPTCSESFAVPHPLTPRVYGRPASQSQLRCLAAHGNLTDYNYSEGEALDLIGCSKRSKAKPNYELADQRRELIWEIETRSTNKEIAKLAEKLAIGGISEENASYLKEDIEMYKDRLEEIAEEREEWKEDAKADKQEAKERIREFQEELSPHGEWTKHIKKPTQTQIKGCLEALDRNHPDWEMTNGTEPLVATLIATFPELKKKGAPTATNQSAGCLVLITAIVLVVYFMGSAIA